MIIANQRVAINLDNVRWIERRGAGVLVLHTEDGKAHQLPVMSQDDADELWDQLRPVSLLLRKSGGERFNLDDFAAQLQAASDTPTEPAARRQKGKA